MDDGSMDKKRKVRSFLVALLTSVLTGWFPIVFLYAQNVAEVRFSDAAGLCGIFASGAILVLCILRLLVKDWEIAAVLTGTALILVENYSLFSSVLNLVFSDVRIWHYLIGGAYVVGVLAWFLAAPKRREVCKTICSVILLVFAGLIALNLLTAVPGIVVKLQQPQKVEIAKNSEGEGKPNFYFFVMDECASFSTIQKEYGYTNTEYYDFLKNHNFMISDNSTNHYPQTAPVMANCMNLDYVANMETSGSEINAFFINPVMVRVFEENGYHVRGVGDTAWLGVKSITAGEKTYGTTLGGETFVQLFLNRTCFEPFLNKSLSEKGELVLNAFEAIQSSGTIIPNSGQMNIFYVESPHQPFVFDKNGMENPPTGYNDWDDPQYYLGQYVFIMKQLQKSVRNILENDPDCVLFLSSDHGPRFKPGIEEAEKTRIFHAVYYRGEAMEEVRDFSSVDTLRTICNRLLGTDYEMKG